MIAEPLRLEDMQEICEMHMDPSAMRFVGGTRNAGVTKLWLEENLAHWRNHGFGQWVFRDRASKSLVGRCGLRFVQLDYRKEVELGYSVLARHWGQGLAPEMGTAVLSMGFERLGLKNVIALVYEANTPSRRVAEKLGFQFVGITVWKSEPAMLWRLERDAWIAMK